MRGKNFLNLDATYLRERNETVRMLKGRMKNVDQPPLASHCPFQGELHLGYVDR